jgi:hypothetical protein
MQHGSLLAPECRWPAFRPVAAISVPIDLLANENLKARTRVAPPEDWRVPSSIVDDAVAVARNRSRAIADIQLTPLPI